MTLSRLAKLAHVSVSTASKAFSMSREVNEQTRQMIFAVARQEGCFKQFFSARYPRFVVAILCPELDSLYYSGLVTALHRELTARGCDICTAVTDFSADTLTQRIAYYDAYAAVDGILLIGHEAHPLPPHETPLVAIGSRREDAVVSAAVDFTAAVRAAVAHLCAGGVTDIGFIGEPLTRSKQAAFVAAMEEVVGGAEPRRIVVSDRRFEPGGYRAAQQLLEGGQLPGALLCAYDRLAFGALRCLTERGLAVPGDVRLMGMDNLAVDAYTVPSLSSIGVDNGALAQWAVSRMLAALTGSAAPGDLPPEPQLYLRESSAF